MKAVASAHAAEAVRTPTGTRDADPVGAFARRLERSEATGTDAPLAGLTFGIKDVFDIAGEVTGAGNPAWAASHLPATETAPAVARLLACGARIVGKTHTDELAYSLNGENAHYGTPINSRAPDRIPGGSSSGSAAAVAAGLVDVGLGTDCGGSIRLPASYCGLFGLRPTHGRIPLDRAVPLAPSFDTVGWFARDLRTMERVAAAYFSGTNGAAPAATPTARLFVADDLFRRVPEAVRAALGPALAAARAIAPASQTGDLIASFGTKPLETFRTIQGREAWDAHGDWIQTHAPDFGPGIRERFDLAAHILPEQAEAARRTRAEIAAHLTSLVAPGTLVCLPSAPGVAPLRNSPPGDLEEFRQAALALLCPAGLAGLPQLSLPLAELEGAPLGLSLVGARGEDMALFRFADALLSALGMDAQRDTLSVGTGDAA